MWSWVSGFFAGIAATFAAKAVFAYIRRRRLRKNLPSNAYYGGRFETFPESKHAIGRPHLYDVNSAYPKEPST